MKYEQKKIRDVKKSLVQIKQGWNIKSNPSYNKEKSWKKQGPSVLP